MIRIILTVALLFVAFSSNLKGQQFSSVGGGISYTVESLYSDTVNNYIYAGGLFSQAGGQLCRSVARWDGASWDSIKNNISGGARGLMIYNNELYAGGGFSKFDISLGIWKPFSALIKWDISTLDWIAPFNPVNGNVFELILINNFVYAIGEFDSIGGIGTDMVARYDGQNWYGYPVLAPTPGWSVSALTFFNNELYVGGNFDGGISNPFLKDIAKFDGTQWLPVGTGFSGGMTDVTAFTIYQGKLIVAGSFHTSYGDPGNGIAAWDGSSWSPVGTNLISSYTRCLIVYNGELWAGGVINIGNGNWNGVVKLVGNQWVAPAPFNMSNVLAFAQLGNDLYIAGSILEVFNGDTARNIARYNPLTGFQSIETPQSSFQISPNPAASQLTLQYSPPKTTGHATVYNVLGEAVQQLSLPSGTTRHQLNIATLPAGLYLIKVEADGKSGVKRFVKK